MNKKIKLQQREYIGADGITKYKQCRINIPHEIIQKIGWNQEEQITISVESKRNSKKLILLSQN
ncbi:hypothetical protein [Nitrosopumilus sp.]|uniref:hypothetical protein n=1 Tax=Nitrosopumilus sp. TaxID=2024843 RepID=UPI0029311B50|nr:hypothetical protein [Nitrosopumilus sp.]